MFSALKAIIDPTVKRNIKFAIRNCWQSLAYFQARGFNKVKAINVQHIVFVCQGNICRSSFAEFYLKTLPLNQYLKIESCGLDVNHSVASPPDAILVAQEFGVDLTANRSKGIPACDLEKADLIIAMEYGHVKKLVEKFPHKKNRIAVLRDFAPWPECLISNIKDPYECDIEEFRICFKAIRRALDGLVVGYLK